MNKGMSLCKIYNSMKSERTNWTDHWEDVLRYTLPQRNTVYNRTTGEQRGFRLYDSTPQHFVELLASALHSMLTNPSVKWFGLATGIPFVDRKTRVKKYIQEAVSIVHDVLNASNFQTEIHELYLDVASLGTGCLLIEEDERDIIRFLSIPIFQLVIRENHKGIVDTVGRSIKMSAEQAIQKYGEEAFGDKLHELTKDLTKEIELIHLVMPRENAKREKLDAVNKPFGSYHIWKEHEMLLKEDGFTRFPYVVPRWTKLGNEAYGRSPAMKTLPDIRMLNQMMKTTIRAAQKAVDPPWLMSHDSVLGRLNLTAGGVSIARQGLEDSVKPLQGSGRVDLGMEMINQVRQNIKQGFFIDQLQLGGSDRMTELEVNIRNDENLRLLSPILGRLHNELLDPLVGRVMQILIDKKKFPDNPPMELGKHDLKMNYRSQIAKAQTSNEGRVLSGFLAEVVQMASELQKPEILDKIDFDEVVSIKANLESIDLAIFKNEEDTEEAREARGQFNADQLDQQQRNLEADTAQKQAKAQQGD